MAGRERHGAADRVEFGGVQWVGEDDLQCVVGHLSPRVGLVRCGVWQLGADVGGAQEGGEGLPVGEGQVGGG
ncbi:hypothetical protein ASR50_35245 [Streptomyces sp. 4F]|nr:hypothetical protein ASR50_00190 [Streptomyces sp. 4F]ALV54144.1 hypothetical protein ASR50_35245 [Streptomyces sp. 4F]